MSDLIKTILTIIFAACLFSVVIVLNIFIAWPTLIYAWEYWTK